MTGPALFAAQLEEARRVLPADVVSYVEAGGGDEVSAGEAVEAWARYRLRPRVLTDVAAVDTSLDLLGTRLATPVLVAPTAFHLLAHADGESATARGATAAGSLMTVSTRCSQPLEEVAAAFGGAPWWFQVYVTREPAVYRGLALRARDLGAGALVLTGDTPTVGRKRRLDDVRIAGVDAMWAVNAGQYLAPGSADDALEQSATATTDVIAELRDLTGLPVLVKGLLRGDEAVRCLEAGAGGVIVSNHGGRQLDRAVSSAQALPDVVAAVRGRVPVLVDGGLRGGLDVLTALALGASAVLLGRPLLWALAVGGADGVRDALGAVTDELAQAMALAGAPDLAALTPDLVLAPAWGDGERGPGV